MQSYNSVEQDIDSLSRATAKSSVTPVRVASIFNKIVSSLKQVDQDLTDADLPALRRLQETITAKVDRLASDKADASDVGAPEGICPLNEMGKVPDANIPDSLLSGSDIGTPDGVAPLNEYLRVPLENLPVDYVCRVWESLPPEIASVSDDCRTFYLNGLELDLGGAIAVILYTSSFIDPYCLLVKPGFKGVRTTLPTFSVWPCDSPVPEFPMVYGNNNLETIRFSVLSDSIDLEDIDLSEDTPHFRLTGRLSPGMRLQEIHDLLVPDFPAGTVVVGKNTQLSMLRIVGADREMQILSPHLSIESLRILICNAKEGTTPTVWLHSSVYDKIYPEAGNISPGAWKELATLAAGKVIFKRNSY